MQVELGGEDARDGAELDGWLLVPEGDGPFPLLLNIHGGPATQYGWGYFDEFQQYAAAGFAVVAGARDCPTQCA